MSVKLTLDRSQLGTVILTAACINPISPIVGFIISSILALRNASSRVLAVFLIWLSTSINEGIAVFEGNSLRYGILLMLIAVSLPAANRRGYISLATVITLLLGLAIIAHSASFSLASDVSIFKAVVWTGGMIGILLNWESMSANKREHAIGLVRTGLTTMMLFSLPLALLPLGYTTNGSGFQGVLNQPQNFGVAMAILTSMRGAKIIDRSDPSLGNVLLFLLSLYCVISSEARIAALATGGSLLLAIIIYTISGKLTQLRGLRSRWVVIIFIFITFAAILGADKLLPIILDFITKGGRDGTVGLSELFLASRGILVFPMLSNIDSHLMTGIGFGVASNPEYMQIIRDPIFGLPISAPIEKGVMPIAVLEELGLPIAVGVFFWIFFLLARSKPLGVTAFSIVACFVLINSAENSMFSFGGPGLLGLLLVTGSVIRRS